MPRAQSESLRIYIARAINYKFSKHFAKIQNIGPNWVSLDCTPDFCIIAKIPKYSPLDTRFFLLLQLNVNRSPYLDIKTKTDKGYEGGYPAGSPAAWLCTTFDTNSLLFLNPLLKGDLETLSSFPNHQVATQISPSSAKIGRGPRRPWTK